MKFRAFGGATTFMYHCVLSCALMHHDRDITLLEHELTKLLK